MEVTLERIKENGAYAYEAIFLTQLKSYSFGQMASNDFILYAPTVEYNHCIFHNKPNGLFVEVLKSSWGVLKINGKKYLSSSIVRLNDNDIVNIGLLLKYKVKIKTGNPIADNSDNDYVKSENDEEDNLSHQNVIDSDVENLGNEATLSAEAIQTEISQKVKENLSQEIESGLSLQEIDAAMEIKIGKEENEYENSSSVDSSVETESYHFDSSFQQEHLSDFLLTNDYLPGSLSEKEPLSHSLPEKVPFPNLTENKLLPISSSKEKNLPSTKQSPVSLTEKVLCVKINKLSSVFLEKKNLSSVSKMQLSSDPKKLLTIESLQKKPKRGKPSEKHFLQTHSDYHSTEKVFSCDICGKIFKKKTAIRFHLMTVHSEKKQTNKICKKVYGYKKYQKKHMFSHSTEKQFKCSLCEKDFKRKQDLQKHMLTHSTTERNLKCSLCEKDFGRKDCLRKHMLCHSTEKPFKCSLCEKDFKRKQELKQHMLTHFATERNLKCFLCEKGFKVKKSLRQHMLIHSTEKPFKCSLCEKGFKFKSSLQKHMLTHSVIERNLKCPLCEKDFGRKDCLRQHMLCHSTKKKVQVFPLREEI